MKSLTPFFVIIVCVGIYFAYIKGELGVIKEKKAKFDEYESVLTTVKETKSLKDNLSASYASISSEELQKLDKIIPSKFDAVLFANDVNSLAAKYGLKMDKLKTDYKNPESTGALDAQVGNSIYVTVVANFHVSGTFDNFISFLGDLETSLRLIDVVNINIKPAASTDRRTTSTNIIDYDVEIKTYSLK